jgi:ribosomal protein S18 acetylase RimI-like enzyme
VQAAGRQRVEFVTAEETSIDDFLSVSASSPFQAELRAYAEALLERRSTRASWCLLELDAGVPVARGAFWALPDETVPTDLVLIATDWSDPELDAGRALLVHAEERAAGLGSAALQHHVDDPPGPPQYQEDGAARAQLMTEAGYGLLRDGLRWRLSPPRAHKPPPSPLTFRTLPEVGEESFVEAIAATYEGTRDTWLTRNIEERGLDGAARADFLDYREMDHRPEWWELAYTDDGTLAGVVMPAKNQTDAVVAYVGVVPGQRGRGLAAQLVNRATEQLVAAGARAIVGDCDRDNLPMAKAFRRAGYEQVARRRSYQRALEN